MSARWVLSIGAVLALTGCSGDFDEAMAPKEPAATTTTTEPTPTPTPEPEPTTTTPPPPPTTTPPPPPPAAEPGLTPAETVYILTLDEFDVFYSTEANAISAGWAVCESLDAGFSTMQIAEVAVGEGYTYSEAGYIIGAAIGAFCPEHEGTA